MTISAARWDTGDDSFAFYTLTSIVSPSLMSLFLIYPETVGNGGSQFKSPSLLSHFPTIHHKFDIRVIHQRI